MSEWHPFTLTSAPEEDLLSVHVRSAGDWTGKLHKMLEEIKKSGDISRAPKIAIDGPFGASSQDVFDYEYAVCVGAGIGVTPFASLLRSIFYKKRLNLKILLKKVHFIWICPEMKAFEWFTDLLKHVETQLDHLGERDLLSIQIYLSRGWDTSMAKVCETIFCLIRYCKLLL